MIFRCTIACSIVFFRLILDAWIWAICLFMKNVLLFCYFPTLCTADCKSNYKSRICCFHFANWIPIDLKKGWCEISNILSIENVQWIEHIRTNNGFCCQFQSLCWLNWFGLIWNFSKIDDESGCFFFSGFVLWFRLAFRTFNVYVGNFFSKSTQFSIGTNQQISIDKRLFNKPKHFDRLLDFKIVVECWALPFGQIFATN